MKIIVRFDAFGLRETLIAAAIESMPPDVGGEAQYPDLLAAREDHYREALTRWIEEDGRLVVEFDTEAGAARVLRRDGKDDEARQAVAELLVTIQNYRQGVDWFEDLEFSANAAARAIGEPEFAGGWWREEFFGDPAPWSEPKDKPEGGAK